MLIILLQVKCTAALDMTTSWDAGTTQRQEPGLTSPVQTSRASPPIVSRSQLMSIIRTSVSYLN